MNKQAELGVSYARGFINKMAEAGVPEQASIAYLQKQALSVPTTAGALGGGALAALLAKPEKKVDKDGNEKVKYHRLRNFILGALGGGAVGAAGKYIYDQTPAGDRAARAANQRRIDAFNAFMDTPFGQKLQEQLGNIDPSGIAP